MTAFSDLQGSGRAAVWVARAFVAVMVLLPINANAIAAPPVPPRVAPLVTSRPEAPQAPPATPKSLPRAMTVAAPTPRREVRSSTPRAAAGGPAKPAPVDAARDAAVRGWSPAHFTDPSTSPSDGKYRFMVHMVNPFSCDGACDFARGESEISSSAGARTISLSVIDQDHKGTFGFVGYIVRVPEKNIVATSGADMQSGFSTHQDAAKLAATFPLEAPEKILAGTRGHNEIIAARSDGNSKLEVVGLVQMGLTHAPGDAMKQAFVDYATKRGLPTVVIPQFSEPAPAAGFYRLPEAIQIEKEHHEAYFARHPEARR